jgi:hypothetical protein
VCVTPYPISPVMCMKSHLCYVYIMFFLFFEMFPIQKVSSVGFRLTYSHVSNLCLERVSWDIVYVYFRPSRQLSERCLAVWICPILAILPNCPFVITLTPHSTQNNWYVSKVLLHCSDKRKVRHWTLLCQFTLVHILRTYDISMRSILIFF